MAKEIHINLVSLEHAESRYWVEYNYEIVKTTDKNGKKTEGIELVTTFIKDGKDVHRVYNCGNFDEAVKLYNRDYALSTALRIIEEANKSVHSPFKSCNQIQK